YGFPSGGRPVRRAAWPITQIDPRHSPAGSTRRLRNRIESIWSESALAPGVYTNPDKRAAIQACAVMMTRPLCPAQPKNVSSKKVLLANEDLAFAWASATVDRGRLIPGYDDRKFFYRVLGWIRFPSVDAFLSDHKAGQDTFEKSYSVHLSDDELIAIDTVILRIESFLRSS
ncbi:MAG: hypothetical protein K0U74_14015, partial [Alphaproteobacteria bacterium]|nr:hypothetical protein [Alphaproteobacteria bacterium]